MTVLGIETATTVCSVGVLRGEQTFERSLREDRVHAEKLLTLAQEALEQAGLRPGDLEAIGVSEGPGSFTGLRIGASAAKGLAFGLGIPIVAVSTFSAIVRAARAAGVLTGPAAVCFDARQGDWYRGSFDADGRPQDLAVLRGDALRAALTADTTVLTDAPVLFADAGVSVLDIGPYCRGDVIAVLAAEGLREGRTADAASFEPRYLKEFTVRRAASAGNTRMSGIPRNV